MNLLPRTLSLLLVLWMLWPSDGSCSGVAVTNISLGTRDSGTGDAPISFDISWSNSWRSTDIGAPAPNNWDAAWVFVKYRKNGGDWAHASLSDSGHTVPAGASLDVGLVDTGAAFDIASNPGAGVFIYRSSDGTGTFSKTGFSLIWKFAQDGVSTGDTVDIRVYAIEMVYIPAGAFFAGDNAFSSAAFKQGSSDSDPWYIGSESAITTADAVGSGTGVSETAAEYYYVSGNNSSEDATGSAFTIPAAFPKGYGKIYMMKSEISQYQWVAFFNTLTASQKTSRDVTGATSGAKNSDDLVARNNISWTSGDATLPDRGGGATYAAVAANYLSAADLLAYLDWAGLRPMSELEFERAARGPYRAVSGEYAWGSTSLTQATGITNSGLATEAPSGAANAVYGGHADVPGPLRVGSLAAGDTTRVTSGAGYYGIMELSGNLNERCVSVGRSTSRTFEGRYHGNGSLDSSGNHNVNTWPSLGSRGGDWSNSSTGLRISARSSSANSQGTRVSNNGGRGVRIAP